MWSCSGAENSTLSGPDGWLHGTNQEKFEAVANATTKAEVLANDGFWEMMPGGRTDWAMLLGGIFLLIKGGGKWSVDQELK